MPNLREIRCARCGEIFYTYAQDLDVCKECRDKEGRND